MDLFTYLMAKNGNNTSVHGDLFSYLLGKGQSQTQTISGVTIYIPNAKKLVSFMMTKESTQETTTGKNLYNKTTNDILNTSNTRLQTNNYIALPSGTYTISYTGNVNQLYIMYYDSNHTKIGETNWASGNVTFTYNQDYEYKFTFRKSNNTDITPNDIDNIQIELGSTATEYEEYTGGQPSPNPDYPQEVKTVKGYRNLFDISTVNYASRCTLSNGVYTTSSLIVGTRNVLFGYLSNNQYTINVGETIYVSADIRLVSGTANNLSALRIDDNFTTQSISNPTFTNQFQRYVFSITNDTSAAITKGRILFQPANANLSDAVFEIKNVMISTVNEVYVPYGNNYVNVAVSDGTNTNNYPIPLNNNEIVGIGDYKDELKVDKSGHVFINKKTEKYLYTGNENFEYVSAITNASVFYSINAFSNYARTNFIPLCNYYKGFNKVSGASSARNNGNNSIQFYDSTSSNYCYIVDNRFNSTNNLKNWLQTQYNNGTPVIVYYVLAQENLIDLQTTVDLKLFKGVNNVSNSEDGYMTIEYR